MSAIFGFLIIFFVIAAIICVIAYYEDAKFRTKFPPLSGEEFLAKCDPNVRPEVALKVRKALADALGVDEESIHPSQSIMKDLGGF